jgi:CubicO group peptidase (beta-lactamase class C family)
MRARLLLLLCASLLYAQDPSARIDALFSGMNAKTPGCALGVARDGKPVFARGYGMADLEHDAPISPSTPFYMASVSKQFAAMSVLLLVEDGKVSLDDSVRKYLPELPAYADPVTVRHLLNHTSGVRDYLTLSALAGNPPEFVITDKSAMSMIVRQKALNFTPGSEFLYSNSGYVLLSLIVKQVTGSNLNSFATEHIFGPLGMKSTRFQHDHSALIPGKAFGYELRQGAWHTSNSMLDVVADGGLYSTIDDMLRWAANYDELRVGARAIPIMQTSAKLNDGKESGYGMGLAPDEYRGLKTVDHGGSLVGYRTMFLRFPEQRLTVVCLCNRPVSPARLAQQVAEIYIGDQMKAPESRPAPQRPETAKPLPISDADKNAYAGEYESRELAATWRIVSGDALSVEFGNETRVLTGAGLDQTVTQGGGIQLHFVRDAAGKVTGFHLDAGRIRGIEFQRIAEK